MLTVGSLFSGIGGLDLGLEQAGMRTVWQVEYDDWARGKLAENFPHTEKFKDVREVGKHNLRPVDLICGGFPCQDLSTLKVKRDGLDGEHQRRQRQRTNKGGDTMNLGKFDCSTGVIRVLYSDPIKNISVRTSTVADMLLIDKLQKENAFAVGFIQKTVWEKYVFGGERNFVVFICEANNDPVGYVLITPGRDVMHYGKIQQIAVRNDARRLHYGTALLDVCRQFCEEFTRKGFTLRCRLDLESNHFWRALGFEHYGTWQRGKVNHVGFKASNDINLWKIDLNSNIPGLFDGLIDASAGLQIFEAPAL